MISARTLSTLGLSSVSPATRSKWQNSPRAGEVSNAGATHFAGQDQRHAVATGFGQQVDAGFGARRKRPLALRGMRPAFGGTVAAMFRRAVSASSSPRSLIPRE